ncbi:MAG: helix-turn-helix domain-containing protein [Putridiphycobacter sp.]
MKQIESLSKALKSKGITHVEIAKKFSTTQQNISRILSGKDMKLSMFIKLCEAFNINSNDLMLQDVVSVDPLSNIENTLPKKLEKAQKEIEELKLQIEKYKGQKERIATLEKMIKDKDLIIKLLSEKN